MWREGAWLDLWSLVHLLSGVSFGLGISYLHFGALPSFLLVLVLLIAYELWEAMVRIAEAPTNRLMDVMVGLLGYSIAYWCIVPTLSTAQHLFTFEATVAVNIILATLGWHASQKAAALKERLRKRFAAERATLLKRESRLRKKFKR
ncbi:MAG: hypothetical protein QG621_696 [Patescibacteria group bacterium]|nr:hypothetical protein [Patescibacteria group bacterium]